MMRAPKKGNLVQKEIKVKIKNPHRISLRRMQIINGAIKVFTEKGFHNATVREIAEASGVTEGTLYNYIRCKEDIIYIVYDYTTQILRDEINKAIEGIKDPKERLKAALLQNLHTVNRYQDLIMFLYRESGSLHREDLYLILHRETDYIKLFETLLKEYFKGKGIDPVRLKLGADLLAYIPVIVSFRRWSLNRRIKSIDNVIAGIVEFVLHGIEFVPRV
jgi:TetR/AcrR family transcriptional regulator, cholesterol catabolism regulator